MSTEIAMILAEAKIVPVIRCAGAGEATAVASGLLHTGSAVVELTATTPQWQSALRVLRADFPLATIGVGTIVTAEDAAAAIEGGAAFLVSPWPAPLVRRVADAAGVPFLEGGFTPAEVAAAAGAGVAKLFPAHVGGPAYLRSLLAVMPGARIMPTGGIKVDQAAQWLAAGAIAVGIGSDLDRIAEVRDGL